MSVIVMSAAALLRRHLRSSIALVVFAGLAAALPLALWAAGRRASTAVDEFIARSDAPDVGLDICPPGVDPQVTGDTLACNLYEPLDELALIRSLPEVRAAARASWTTFRGGTSSDPETWQVSTMIQLRDPAETATALGNPVVVAGRLADAEASDEVVVTENGARSFGDLRPGDRVFMQGVDLTALEEPPAGPPVSATVVGIVRTANDLLPLDSNGSDLPSAAFYARSGWSDANAESVPPSSNGIAVWLREGDRDQFVAAIAERLGTRAFHSAPMIDSSQRSTLDQATGFESRAAVAVAVLLGVATTFFVGQTVSRQTRSESVEWPTLRAIGMTQRELVAATLLRWLPVALLAAVVTIAATVAASIAGPIGTARRGPWARGVRFDWTVLAVGAPAVALLVMLGAASVFARRRRRAVVAGRARLGWPAVATGVAFARRSVGAGSSAPVASAIAGIAIAVAVVVVAATGGSSLHRVTSTPARFGAPWDAFVGVANDAESEAGVAARVAAVTNLDAAAMIPGAPIFINEREVWVQAFVPISGLRAIDPVITGGRAPVAGDEIALGSVALRRAGAGIGDEVTVGSGVAGLPPQSMRVVGTTMVTDGFEPNVGISAVVSPAGLERIAPEATGAAAVRVVDGPERAAALESLRAAFPDSYSDVSLPSSLRNAKRVAGLPVPFAVGAALVAVVTLAHALLLTIRRQRREIAVCRVLGFTRGQVHGVVATEATLYALVGGLAGAALGIVGARWAWRRIADALGVASTGAVLSVWFIACCVLGVVLVANLVAGVLGHMAARVNAAAALRAE